VARACGGGGPCRAGGGPTKRLRRRRPEEVLPQTRRRPCRAWSAELTTGRHRTSRRTAPAPQRRTRRRDAPWCGMPWPGAAAAPWVLDGSRGSGCSRRCCCHWGAQARGESPRPERKRGDEGHAGSWRVRCACLVLDCVCVLMGRALGALRTCSRRVCGPRHDAGAALLAAEERGGGGGRDARARCLARTRRGVHQPRSASRMREGCCGGGGDGAEEEEEQEDAEEAHRVAAGRRRGGQGGKARTCQGRNLHAWTARGPGGRAGHA
jgi:hypothetical protein